MQSDDGCRSYLDQIKGDICNKMTLAVSSWGGPWSDMSWLDQDTGCSGDCNNSPTVTIKNIEYTSGNGDCPGPSPPQPTDFEYGNECATKWD